MEIRVQSKKNEVCVYASGRNNLLSSEGGGGGGGGGGWIPMIDVYPQMLDRW